MSGATDWSSCISISTGSDLSSSGSCVTDAQRYLQYQITLTTTDPFSTPTFSDVSLAFTQSSVTTTLDSPANEAYTSSERPSFRFRTGSVAGSALSSYAISIDNGDSGSFSIDDIPVSRTTDYETNK